MSKLPNFTNPLTEHLRTLEKFKSPLSELQQTLSEIGEPQRKLRVQLQEAFGSYNRIHRTQMLELQGAISKYNSEIQKSILPFQSVLKDFESRNSQILKSIGGLNKAFELPHTRILKEFSGSFGVLEEFKKQQQGLLATLRIHESFAEKFKTIAELRSADELVEGKFQVMDSILKEVENGIKYHIEANPETDSQLPIDQILNYVGFLLNILFFLYSSLTDKSEEILHKLSDNEVNIEEKFEQLNSRLDSITELQERLSLRVCIHGTKVYKRPKSTSTVLALVKSDQVVNVVSISSNFKSKKWIFVTYVDFEFGTPQAGWVMKKYFKNETENYR